MKTYTETELDLAETICAGNKTLNVNNILCLGQSDASKGVMFVLYKFIKADAMFCAADPMQFRCILAGNLVDAAKKARKCCGINKIHIDADSNFERLSLELRINQFVSDKPTLLEDLKYDHYIIRNMNDFFTRKGYLSQAQQALITKIIKDDTARKQKIAASKAKEAELEQYEGHHYEEKRQMIVLTDQVTKFGWESAYGFTQLIKWMTAEGKVVQYVGCNPPEVYAEDFDNGGTLTVKATVKHVEFKNKKQTKLSRITVQL